MPQQRPAFTLVELLVVITILVILLALLMPAMGRAIHQTTLVQCGAKLKAAATGVIGYTLESKRHYPDRGIRGRAPETGIAFIPPTALAKPQDFYDQRPVLKKFIPINQMLQCPFVEPVEMVDTPLDVNVAASYAMWWGWGYNTTDTGALPGMYKLGDRFTWTEGTMTEKFRVLVGDYDLDLGANPDDGGVQGSHPDLGGIMYPLAAVDTIVFGFRATGSLWLSQGNNKRKPVDMNQAFDDNSVARFDQVIGRHVGWDNRDKRMGWVPNQFDNRQSWKRYQVPLN